MNGLPAWPPARHPFQVGFGVASLVAGFSGLLPFVPGNALSQLTTTPFYVLWEATLFITGTLLLVAAWLTVRDFALSLLLEQIGTAVLGLSLVIYSIALLWIFGARAVHIGSFIGVIGVSAWFRWWQVTHTLRWLREQQ